MKKENIDTNILAHTKWDCKYHIVFAPNYRRRSMSGSYTYAGKYPTQNERFGIYGIFEREKCPADISKVG